VTWNCCSWITTWTLFGFSITNYLFLLLRWTILFFKVEIRNFINVNNWICLYSIIFILNALWYWYSSTQRSTQRGIYEPAYHLASPFVLCWQTNNCAVAVDCVVLGNRHQINSGSFVLTQAYLLCVTFLLRL
jgi:hypothetical protein